MIEGMTQILMQTFFPRAEDRKPFDMVFCDTIDADGKFTPAAGEQAPPNVTYIDVSKPDAYADHGAHLGVDTKLEPVKPTVAPDGIGRQHADVGLWAKKLT